jgi:PAS domain S-box-containing protein
VTDHQERSRFEAEFARTDASTDPFVSAVRATRMPMLITDPNQPDNPIVFVNAAFSKLTGYGHDEIVGQNCRFLQGPETNRDDIARIRSAIARRVSIEIELLNHKKDGEVFWNRLLISPVFDQDGELTYFFASQFDVTLERDKLA